MLLNRGIQPACTMLLEAVDVAAIKAIPKGARTAFVCPGLHDVARMERQQGWRVGWGGGT
jgi:hypothetical protein